MIYAENHGCSRLPNWVKDSVEWLSDVFGPLTMTGMGEPSRFAKLNGNRDPMLSVDCSIGYLRTQGGQLQVVLGPVFEKVSAMVSSFGAEGQGNMPSSCWSFRLWEVLSMMQFPIGDIEKMDVRLEQVRPMYTVLEDYTREKQRQGQVRAETHPVTIVHQLFMVVRAVVIDWCIGYGRYDLNREVQDILTPMIAYFVIK